MSIAQFKFIRRPFQADSKSVTDSSYNLNVPTATVSLTGTSSKLFRGDSPKRGIVLGYAEVVSFWLAVAIAGPPTNVRFLEPRHRAGRNIKRRLGVVLRRCWPCRSQAVLKYLRSRDAGRSEGALHSCRNFAGTTRLEGSGELLAWAMSSNDPRPKSHELRGHFERFFLKLVKPRSASMAASI